MLSWDVVKDFTVESPPTYALGRLPEVEERYTRHRNHINESKFYKSIAEYIIKDVIGDNEYVFVENSVLKTSLPVPEGGSCTSL